MSVQRLAAMPNRKRVPKVSAECAARLDDRDWTEARYVDEAMSIRQIGALLGCSSKTARFALKAHRIPLRRPGAPERDPAKERLLADADWLHARYVDDGLTIQQIADDVLHVHNALVSDALRKAGIELRPSPVPRRGTAPDVEWRRGPQIGDAKGPSVDPR